MSSNTRLLFTMTDELTNLNWLCSITTINGQHCQQRNLKVTVPTKQQTLKPRNATTILSTKANLQQTTSNTQNAGDVSTNQQTISYTRPPCSYSCLIAMALKACSTGCLPVHEIYRFIEHEYPFYKTAPEGWKNSIRHNLSMNQNFVKVQRPDGFQTKKGFFWAINPDRQHLLDIEIERALKTMGRQLVEYSNTESIQHSYSKPKPVTDNIIQEPPDPTAINLLEPVKLKDETSFHTESGDFLCYSPKTTVREDALDKLNIVAGLKTSMQSDLMPKKDHAKNTFSLLPSIKDDKGALLDIFGDSFDSNITFNNDCFSDDQISQEQRDITVPVRGKKRPLSVEQESPKRMKTNSIDYFLFPVTRSIKTLATTSLITDSDISNIELWMCTNDSSHYNGKFESDSSNNESDHYVSCSESEKYFHYVVDDDKAETIEYSKSVPLLSQGLCDNINSAFSAPNIKCSSINELHLIDGVKFISAPLEDSYIQRELTSTVFMDALEYHTGDVVSETTPQTTPLLRTDSTRELLFPQGNTESSTLST